MKNRINITVSLPIETHNQLKVAVGDRTVSSFVTELINDALRKKRDALRAAYLEAENDPETQEVLNDWDKISVEGWE